MLAPEPVQPPPDTPGETDASATEPSDGGTTITVLREEAQALAMSDALDKAASLGMMRIFYDLELHHRQEIASRDARIATLEHALQQQRMRVEFDRLATRHIQEEAIQRSVPPRRASR